MMMGFVLIRGPMGLPLMFLLLFLAKHSFLTCLVTSVLRGQLIGVSLKVVLFDPQVLFHLSEQFIDVLDLFLGQA